ncbi:hypothetical protein J6590_044671 [Homalodisca vitripennis]|nr:hypothetical protein J6590_044671 [Homalodisca vitripennis]
MPPYDGALYPEKRSVVNRPVNDQWMDYSHDRRVSVASSATLRSGQYADVGVGVHYRADTYFYNHTASPSSLSLSASGLGSLLLLRVQQLAGRKHIDTATTMVYFYNHTASPSSLSLSASGLGSLLLLRVQQLTGRKLISIATAMVYFCTTRPVPEVCPCQRLVEQRSCFRECSNWELGTAIAYLYNHTANSSSLSLSVWSSNVSASASAAPPGHTLSQHCHSDSSYRESVMPNATSQPVPTVLTGCSRIDSVVSIEPS